MQTQITEQKLEKYLKLTEKSLKIAEKKIVKGKEKQAKEILEMVKNYLSDSKFFREKGNYVDSFSAVNYAHGWLDSGVRLGIFNVKNNKLFTIQ